MEKYEGTFGGTVLHKYAKSGGWTRLIASANSELLLKLNEHHRTPLHYAVESGAPEEVILELIRLSPGQVRVPDTAGETPMHLGAQFGMGLLVLYGMLDADATVGRGKPALLGIQNKSGMNPVQIIREAGVIRRKLKIPWKHCKDDYQTVLGAMEESANGQTGVIGLAY